MGDEGGSHARFSDIPIPSYDEAIAHPSSSRNHRGPEEVSDDAERQGLLGRGRAPGTYTPPTVESARSSEDSDLPIPEMTGERDHDRRQIEELDYLDPSAEDQSRRSLYSRSRQRTKFTQHLSNLSATLSSIRLPSIRSFYSPVNTARVDSDLPPMPRQSLLSRAVSYFPRVPDRYRLSVPTVARLFGLATIGIFIWALFAMDIFPNTGRHMTMRYDPESVRTFVQEKIDATSIVGYLDHLTSYDHVAGTEGDLYMAEWMRERWESDGHFDEIQFSEYYVYLNYPRTDGSGRSVRIVRPQDRETVAPLEEKIIDPEKLQTYVWHALSPSGEAEGHLVYVNAGRAEDLAWLSDRHVVLQGAIALMRHVDGQDDLAYRIHLAEEAGCVGVLVFSPPADGQTWPDGPTRPDDSVQRGSVASLNWVLGDPLTPGWTSNHDSRVISRNESMALGGIPSLPISWVAAKELLDAIGAHGVPVPDEWIVGSISAENRWSSGSAATEDTVPIVHLENNLDENEKQHIWNVHGMIWGQETPNKKIIVGSHRDAWCFGAINPGSSAAVMMELVSVFGQLREHGWRPLRTIEFVSWDASEYNLIGSTEFVEEFMDELRKTSYAYINVGAGVSGPDSKFTATGSPLWMRSLLHTLKRISDPGSNETLRTTWDQEDKSFDLSGLDGDHVAFQNLAGVSSIDIGFHSATTSGSSQSCYDNFQWMSKFGDPDFTYHKALAQVWALLILEIADRPLLPLDLRVYASAIQDVFLPNLRTFAASVAAVDFDVTPLAAAADEFTRRADAFHRFEDTWTAHVQAASGLENNHMALSRIAFNNAIADFERDLLDLPVDGENADDEAAGGGHGMPGREQYKHVITSPRAVPSQGDASFPAVRDALAAGDWTLAQRQLEKAAVVLQRAVDNLVKSTEG